MGYTAFQIARALAVTPQRVRALLAMAPREEVPVRGQRTSAWEIKDFPDSIRSRLLRFVRLGNYRSISHLLDDPQLAFECSIPLKEMNEEALGKAVRLMQYLAPILSQADRLSILQMAQRAHLAIASDEQLRFVSLRTVRRQIKRILKRDGGRADWGRLEMYAEEFVARHTEQPTKISQDGFPCRNLECVAEAISCDGPQTLLVAACNDLRALSAMLCQRRAKALVLDALQRTDALSKISREALRKQIDRMIVRGEIAQIASGPTRRRAERRGRKSKFNLAEGEKNALRHLRLVRGSLALAIEELISHAACLPGTRRMIIEELDTAARDRRMPRWPLSIRRAGYVSPDIEAAFRGRKAFQEFELVERRGMFFRDDEGRTLPVEAGTIYESDDMSLNEPFSWIDPRPRRSASDVRRFARWT